MKQKVYWVVGLLHIVCYYIFRKFVKEIDEDLVRFSGGKLVLDSLLPSCIEKSIELFSIIDYLRASQSCLI